MVRKVADTNNKGTAITASLSSVPFLKSPPGIWLWGVKGDLCIQVAYNESWSTQVFA